MRRASPRWGRRSADVPEAAAVVFVGGTVEWKWQTLTMWTRAFPRVHVGKVGSRRLLKLADFAGAESIDSTGFFRGGPKAARRAGPLP